MSRTLIPLKDVPIGSTVIDKETKYYGAPIEWTVIGQNHADDHAQHSDRNVTTIQTKHIIASKAFDAAERYLKGYTYELTDHIESGKRYMLMFNEIGSTSNPDEWYTNIGQLSCLTNNPSNNHEIYFENSSFLDSRRGINVQGVQNRKKACWTVTDIGSGIYTFKNEYDGSYLSNNNGNIGTSLYISDSSKWTFENRTGENHPYRSLTSVKDPTKFIRVSNGASAFRFGSTSRDTDGRNANVYFYRVNEYEMDLTDTSIISGPMASNDDEGNLILTGVGAGNDTSIRFPRDINIINYSSLRIEFEKTGGEFALKYHKQGAAAGDYRYSTESDFIFSSSSGIKNIGLDSNYLPIDELVIFDRASVGQLKIKSIIFFGPYTHASNVPTLNGNSDLYLSNITGWLNNSGDWFIKRDYKDRPPIKDNLLNGYNAYYNEPGFMSNISTMLKRNMLDTSKSGYEFGRYIFMLSDTELYSSGGYEYFTSSDQRKKTRTQECIDNSDSGEDVYWTRTRYSTYEDQVILVVNDGTIDNGFAYDGRVGIVPAVLLDGDKVYVYEDEDNEDVYIVDFGVSFVSSNSKLLSRVTDVKKINMFVNYSPANADIKVEVTNVFNSPEPIWEDATESFKNRKTYEFTNRTLPYGGGPQIAMRVTIHPANGEQVSCDSYGFTFS